MNVLLAKEKIISLAVNLKYCGDGVTSTGKDVQYGEGCKTIGSGSEESAQS